MHVGVGLDDILAAPASTRRELVAAGLAPSVARSRLVGGGIGTLAIDRNGLVDVGLAAGIRLRGTAVVGTGRGV